MIGVTGSSRRLFEVLSLEEINVIFTQASSDSICIGILNEDAEAAETVINRAFEIEILQQKNRTLHRRKPVHNCISW
jgi:aspartokinase/homoserine dehydrogenase 1